MQFENTVNLRTKTQKAIHILCAPLVMKCPDQANPDRRGISGCQGMRGWENTE